MTNKVSRHGKASSLHVFSKYQGTRALDETSIDDIPIVEQQAYWAHQRVIEDMSEEMSETEMDQIYSDWHEAQTRLLFVGKLLDLLCESPN